MKSLKHLADGFVNVLKGLGGKKDATMYADFISGTPITSILAENLYTYSWLCAKLINLKVEDATKNWRTLQVEKIEQQKELEKYYTQWGVKDKLIQAAKWGRLYGGAVIIAIFYNEDPTEPLDFDKISPDSLLNLAVLDKNNVFPEQIEYSVLSPNYAMPKYYTVVRDGQRIHHSRVLRFDGIISTFNKWEENNYWGLSVLTTLFDPIASAEEASSLIRNLLYEAKVDVYKIAGLNQLATSGKEGEQATKKRLELVQEGKSLLNAVVLDSEDDYSQKTANFANLAEIDDRFGYKVCGAGDTPFTRVYGRSPAGLNATGDSDLINYYDGVQAYQINELTLKLNWLDKILLANQGFKENFEWKWNPIKQLTETEKSNLEKQNSDRDKTYWDMGILEEKDILLQLAAKQVYVSLTEERVNELLAGFDLTDDLVDDE